VRALRVAFPGSQLCFPRLFRMESPRISIRWALWTQAVEGYRLRLLDHRSVRATLPRAFARSGSRSEFDNALHRSPRNPRRSVSVRGAIAQVKP
jgi:hypothetical protein